MPHKADPTVICHSVAIISKYYMPKHIQTAKHTRDMVGRENMSDKYKNGNIYTIRFKRTILLYM
jgi:hypothetical protein